MYFQIAFISILSVLFASTLETESSHKAPKVFLQGYRELNSITGKISSTGNEFRTSTVFSNKFISKNSTDYTISNVTGLVFSCLSLYPVEWTLPRPTQLPSMDVRIFTESQRYSNFAPALQSEPANRQFTTSLSISNFGDLLNVNLTCKEITLNDTGKEYSQQTTIRLLTASQVPSATSEYPASPPLELIQPHSILRNKAKVEVGDVLKCCAESTTRPQVWFRMCKDGRLQCEILRQSNLNLSSMANDKAIQLTSKASEYGCIRIDGKHIFPGLIYCKGDGIDYLGEFVEIFRSVAVNVDQRRMEIINRPSNSFKVALTTYRDVGNNKNVSVAEKIIILVGHNGPAKSRRALVQLTSTAVLELKEGGNGTLKSDQTHEYGRNSYYEGEVLKIMCFGLKYFYSSGSYLRLNWKGGSKSILQRGSEKTAHTIHLYGGASRVSGFRGNDVIPHISTGTIAHPLMSSVDCFMPQLKSGDWDRFRYPLMILPSSLPKIAGAEEEVVLLTPEEKNVTRVCSVLKAVPVPKVYLVENGKVLKQWQPNKYGSKTTIEVEISFEWIPGGNQSKLYCVAKNVKGRAVKTYKIIQSDNLNGTTTAK